MTLQTQQAAAEAMPQIFRRLTVEDWESVRRVQLDDVPGDATVGEVLDEVCRLMDLPRDANYELALDERALNHTDTLDEAGVTADAATAFVITPEVSAG